jgi:hypothetical protein
MKRIERRRKRKEEEGMEREKREEETSLRDKRQETRAQEHKSTRAHGQILHLFISFFYSLFLCRSMIHSKFLSFFSRFSG